MKNLIKLILSVTFLLVIQCNAQQKSGNKELSKSDVMVKNQIVKRGVTDQKVVQAMRKIERHKFVPAEYQHQAYEDHPLPIGEGQTISQPYIVALMTEVLEVDSTEKVLEIGTGSGYQAAVLAEICDSVYTIELVESLGKRAKKLLNQELGYDNVKVKIGDGYKGWEEHAPFDGIIVTCSPTHIPAPLKEQLAEGGRMIIPVGDYYQELVLLKKKNGKIKQEDIIPVRFVPMKRQNGEKY